MFKFLNPFKDKNDLVKKSFDLASLQDSTLFRGPEISPVLRLNSRSSTDTINRASDDSLDHIAATSPQLKIEKSPRSRQIEKPSQSVNFLDLRDSDFEIWCVGLLRGLGYSAELTSKTNDKGIDIFARSEKLSPGGHYLYLETVVCQCKGYSETTLVGSPEIRNFIGSMLLAKARKGYFITNSTFTTEAKRDAELASEYGFDVHLFDREKLMTLCP